jgi:hypothetical protein
MRGWGGKGGEGEEGRGRGEVGRNDPNIVCTYEYNKKRKKKMEKKRVMLIVTIIKYNDIVGNKDEEKI